MPTILKSFVKKIFLSVTLTTACLGSDFQYKPLELNRDTVTRNNFGHLDHIVKDSRETIYQLLSQTDLVSFSQTSRAFYFEIQPYLTPPSIFNLNKIHPLAIARGLQGNYKNFKGTLKLINSSAQYFPLFLPFCMDVVDLDLSKCLLHDFVDDSKSNTPFEYIGNLKSLEKLEKLHISKVTMNDRWGILPILKSPYLKKLHTLSWTNSDIHDSFKETTLSLKVLNLTGSKISKDTYTTLSETPSFQDLEKLDLSHTHYLEKNKPIMPDLSNLLTRKGGSFLVFPKLKKLRIPSSVLIPSTLRQTRPDLKILQIPYNK